ncbi:MAG: UTP--glucose-1-phosphate uridylyltransferase [Nitrospinaceae bacterium]|jgi:UTP--glucose-1-phosphate uridylyltransferase|nr:UTP--glucose-1-phosphate uridylyltransferase [Nitrospinaceae bacterium]|tara:strand:+ start:3217 stop:4578 length:1362 start_codon:yes stop_codon:yes gene_type:complete
MNTEQLKKLLNPYKMNEAALGGFIHLYEKSQKGPAKVLWKSMKSPDDSRLVRYDSLKVPERAYLEAALARLGVCKLNGGLGTTMGCRRAKSAIVVREKKTLLDLTVEQIVELNRKYQADIPILLMNSFRTHDETERLVGKYLGNPETLTFCQNQFPRLLEEGGGFLDLKKFGSDVWYPPGHGDLYSCLADQGYLDRLLTDGREILFVSNVDNLGAVVDLRILHYMLSEDIPFLMEVTPKTAADTKGGTLYQEKGRIKLLEVANVPPEHVAEFCGQQKFKVFNTNNIWINLVRLKELLGEGPLGLDVIVNRKMVKGQSVLQLETAVGAAFNSFLGAVGLIVPRDRFFPVKRTCDLFYLWSDLFHLERGSLKRNPERINPDLPRITLHEPFEDLQEFQKRIPVPPSMVGLDSLEIGGEVRFNGAVTLKGTVRLIANKKSLRIPKGRVLENEDIEQ